MEECKVYLTRCPQGVWRVSEIYQDGPAQTLELQSAPRCQNVYSVAKTFVMTAIGLLYDRGLLRPEDRLCDILQDELPRQNMDPRWHESTVHMALKHQLGLPAGFLDIDVTPQREFTGDFLSYALTYPLVYEPGTEARYSDGAYYLLARAAEKAAGEPLDVFLWRELLGPMDFQEAAWTRCPKGHVIGATGLYLHASDMVKLGRLYLTHGLYEKSRLLSEEWTRMALERQYALDKAGSLNAFSKGGMYGQRLWILPEQNRAVAIQSYTMDDRGLYQWVLEYGDRP